MERHLHLGSFAPLGKGSAFSPLRVPAHHLTTHCFTAGASGSGKTGATLGMMEEALRQGVPVLLIDVKGDLTNLGLNFPSYSPAPFERWVQPTPGDLVHRAITNRRRSRPRDREYLPVRGHRCVYTGCARQRRQTTQKPLVRVRNVHDANGTVLVQPRFAISYMRGPLTPAEIRQLRAER